MLMERWRKFPRALHLFFRRLSIPGIGASGGVTFLLEDRAGMDVGFLGQQTQEIYRSGSEAPGNRQDHHHSIAERSRSSISMLMKTKS